MPIGDVVAFASASPHVCAKPWLIVGKGPSADRVDKVNLTKYNVITLNHACTLVRPLIAHFVDIEALKVCLEGLMIDSRMRPDLPLYVCAPWYPHFNFRASMSTLATWLESYTPLPETKTLSYNSTTAGRMLKNANLSTIRLRYFSAVAAFNILARVGERVIYTIGVDGGSGYSKHFDVVDRLANGRKSFDVQTAEIMRTCKDKGITWTKL